MKKALAIGLLLATSGCAELTSIYHAREVPADKARVVTMDAKQRNILMVPSPKDDKGSIWRMCAEAAPDAFSALSASGSLTADIKTQSGKAAAALAETAGTIERTQTINLLRESMYRTCERYLSGALTWDQFIIQAARDQKSMVAVLAIEQLTRAARPAATILTPAGTSSFVANGEEQAALVAKFVSERDDAKAAEADAQRAFKDVAADCKDLPTPPAGADEAAAAKWSTCNTARGRLADRTKDRVAATERLDKLLSAMGGAAGLVTGAGAATMGAVPQGGSGQAGNAADLTRIAEAVEKIALGTGIDEALMFCIAHLGRTDANQVVVNECMPILRRRAERDYELRNDLLPSNTETRSTQDTDFRKRLFSSGIPSENLQGIGLTNPARDALTAYTSTSLPSAERQRRLKILHEAAKRLRIEPDEVAITIAAGDRELVTALLNATLAAEPEPSGRAVLTITP